MSDYARKEAAETSPAWRRAKEHQALPSAMSDDEMANAMIVTGAVWGALHLLPAVTKAVPDKNTVTLELNFMKSAYRLTVERIPDGDPPA